jgi:hypothetical protein
VLLKSVDGACGGGHPAYFSEKKAQALRNMISRGVLIGLAVLLAIPEGGKATIDMQSKSDDVTYFIEAKKPAIRSLKARYSIENAFSPWIRHALT